MKARHLIVLSLFLSLSAFLILTSAQYVQCQHEHPNEPLDFSGVYNILLSPFQTHQTHQRLE